MIDYFLLLNARNFFPISHSFGYDNEEFRANDKMLRE